MAVEGEKEEREVHSSSVGHSKSDKDKFFFGGEGGMFTYTWRRRLGPWMDKPQEGGESVVDDYVESF